MSVTNFWQMCRGNCISILEKKKNNTRIQLVNSHVLVNMVAL